jgi:hypothetical protein
LFCYLAVTRGTEKKLNYRKNFGGSNVFHISEVIFWQELCQNKIFCSLSAVKDDFPAGTSSKYNLPPTDSFFIRFIKN